MLNCKGFIARVTKYRNKYSQTIELNETQKNKCIDLDTTHLFALLTHLHTCVIWDFDTSHLFACLHDLGPEHYSPVCTPV